MSVEPIYEGILKCSIVNTHQPTSPHRAFPRVVPSFLLYFPRLPTDRLLTAYNRPRTAFFRFLLSYPYKYLPPFSSSSPSSIFFLPQLPPPR